MENCRKKVQSDWIIFNNRFPTINSTDEHNFRQIINSSILQNLQIFFSYFVIIQFLKFNFNLVNMRM